MKKFLILSVLILIHAVIINPVFAEPLMQTQTFYNIQETSLMADKYNEERVITFPEKPLQFESKVTWELLYGKKWTFFTFKKAFIKMEILNSDGKGENVTFFNPKGDKSGTLNLKAGQICRLTIFTGRYSNVFNNYGAKLNMLCRYQNMKILVKATEMDSPGRFKLDMDSNAIPGWTWTLPDGKLAAGNSIETVIPPGFATIKLSNIQVNDPFQFVLFVPSPLEVQPDISVTEGYEDLPVSCTMKITNHYQSSSDYFWDFGDNSPVQTNKDAFHIYQQPGIYHVKLKVVNSLGDDFETSWEITVKPFNIINGADVSPVRGPIPLTMSYHAAPAIFGNEPVSFQYLWDFGDGFTSKDPEGVHIYEKVGNFTLKLITIDKYHPTLPIDPWIKRISVTPPVLDLEVSVSKRNGIIPLQVDFGTDLKIEGGPTDIQYFWDFNDGETSFDTNPSHTFTEPGRYEVQLIVKDRLYGAVVTKNIRIDAEPPILDLTVSPSQYEGIIPLDVKFVPNLKIEGGPAKIECDWDFNDGTKYQSDGSNSIRHTFTQPGVYKVNITATDKNYHTKASTQVIITAKSPIVTSRCSVYPLSGFAPAKISCVGNAEVKGNPVQLEYTWFIDGQSFSFDKDLNYIFITPGPHTISVIITDTLPGHTGRDSQYWNINIQAPPTPSASLEPSPTPSK